MFPSKYNLILIFSLLVFLSLPSYAFVNIESLRQSEKMGFLGATGLEFNGQSGNTEKIVAAFTTENIYKVTEAEYLFLANYKYGESAHIKDTHQGVVHFRYSHTVIGLTSLETFAQMEFNEFTLLDLRTLLGVGARRILMKQPYNSLAVGIGFFYEQERLKNISNEETIRLNNYLSYSHQFKKEFSGQVIVYYQPSTKEFSDFRVHLDTGLKYQVSSLLALTADYDVRHDSDPPPGVKYTDTTYMTGISLSY